ncbi:MAG: hypothetical protein HFJ09_01175 [Lachnospiraceae bacterium]|nr:hypothetical protein [Lachnospiraceae bacterium]
MEYKITPKALWESLEIMETQYKKMKYCCEELESVLSLNPERKVIREGLKDMEEQMQELWKLRRILERVLVKSEKQEHKILEQLEGKQRKGNTVLVGKVELGHLSDVMEELQIWIQ